MMMISAHGRLARDPKPVNTHSGKPMTTATLAVSLDLRENSETKDGVMWVQVIAFGKLAEILERHQQGEMINVAGNTQPSRYTTNDDEVRENVTVIIDSLTSAGQQGQAAASVKRNRHIAGLILITNRPGM